MSSGRLEEVAHVIRKKKSVEREITSIVGRPVEKGHVGEFIAACIFGVELHKSASAKGNDGVFKSGPLVGKTVNVKWYMGSDNLLDLNPSGGTDYYLVLSGGRKESNTSRDMERPWTIDFVYLFKESELMHKLGERGVKVGVATSVRAGEWESAEVYPTNRGPLELDDEQRRLLRLFST